MSGVLLDSSIVIAVERRQLEPDAIAATALAHPLTVMTTNTKQLSRVSELAVEPVVLKS